MDFTEWSYIQFGAKHSKERYWWQLECSFNPRLTGIQFLVYGNSYRSRVWFLFVNLWKSASNHFAGCYGYGQNCMCIVHFDVVQQLLYLSATQYRKSRLRCWEAIRNQDGWPGDGKSTYQSGYRFDLGGGAGQHRDDHSEIHDHRKSNTEIFRGKNHCGLSIGCACSHCHHRDNFLEQRKQQVVYWVLLTLCFQQPGPFQ